MSNYHQRAIADRHQPPLLEGDQLKGAVRALEGEVVEKVILRQNGIPTGFDINLLDLVKQLQQLDTNLPWEESIRRLGSEGEGVAEALRKLQLFLRRRQQGRLAHFDERHTTAPEDLQVISDIGIYERIMSQGVLESMQWKGIPIFKTAFDFSLYPMLLWNLKPKTIVELGSGMGASAIWLADIMEIFEIEGHVYSVDLNKPELSHKRVSFIQGDCLVIEKVFEEGFLRSLPHPWLLIEDAHVNLYGILSNFHHYIQKGDYIVIEDSLYKRDVIGEFMRQRPDCYRVDTHYTDFFGRNSTCALDSIFIRI